MAKLKPSRVLSVNRSDRLRSTSLNAAVTAGCCRTAGSDRRALGTSGMQEHDTIEARHMRINAVKGVNRIRDPIFNGNEEKRANGEKRR